MKKLIEALYGRDLGDGFDWYVESADYRKRQDALRRQSDKLLEELSPEQQEKLGKLLDRMLESLSIEAEKAFADGFRLASEIWLEVSFKNRDDG